MRRCSFPCRGCGVTEALGFPGGGVCLEAGEGSPAVLTSGISGFGGMIIPLGHCCCRCLRSAGGSVCILSFLCLNEGKQVSVMLS